MGEPADTNKFDASNINSKDSIDMLAKLYREAVDGGDQGLAATAQTAIGELADAQAALSKAATLAAFVSSHEA